MTRRMAGQHVLRLIGITATCIAIAVTAACSNDNGHDKTITIGWTAWADADFMAHLVKQQIESHTDLTVDTQKLTIGVQYKAVARGDVDGMVMAWLPDTHKNYWQDVHDDVVDLGPLYTHAVVGWAVPDYVSTDKVDSIADLDNPDTAKLFGGVIQGIDPGAGEMRESTQSLKAYDINDLYTLKEGSEQSMTDALADAIRHKKPIVVTLWTPHWAFGKWNLRFLRDPKNVFGGPQHVDAVVRGGFREDHPVVTRFLTNLHIPIQDLQKALYAAHQTDQATAIKQFVTNHKGLIRSWWIGTGADISGAAADAAMPD